MDLGVFTLPGGIARGIPGIMVVDVAVYLWGSDVLQGLGDCGELGEGGVWDEMEGVDEDIAG